MKIPDFLGNHEATRSIDGNFSCHETVSSYHYLKFTPGRDCEIEALRALVYRATEHYVAGEDMTRLASMAKLKAGRLAREVSDACLQYWGGQGYMEESIVARSFRDSRLLSIAGGTDEVMLGIICKIDGMLQ